MHKTQVCNRAQKALCSPEELSHVLLVHVLNPKHRSTIGACWGIWAVNAHEQVQLALEARERHNVREPVRRELRMLDEDAEGVHHANMLQFWQSLQHWQKQLCRLGIFSGAECEAFERA